MIKKISLKNIRRFNSLEIDIKNKNVLILGSNAKGKTTILETIYLISCVKSHRTNNLKEVIKKDKPFGEIIIYADKKYRVIISDEGKKVFINDAQYEKISSYIGNFLTVFFSPNDLNIIYGTPNFRRKNFNREISQLKPSYVNTLVKYNKILQERNNCLRQKENKNMTILDVLTKELIEEGTKIIQTRIAFINEINKYFNKYYSFLATDEMVSVKYIPNINLEDYKNKMDKELINDINKGTTSLGPHRDDFCFILNENEARLFASQGQIRSLALAFKLTICKIIFNYKKDYPILLLDDVLSELDLSRREKLLALIKNMGQTFISSTDTLGIKDECLKTYQIIELKE